MATRLDTLEESFLQTIKDNDLIQNGDVIVVGVSGGPDSITLLTCFNKYKEKLKYNKIIVAHVNHLIREDSTDDEKYVEDICKKYGVQCYIKRANVLEIAKKQKKGTEEVGREIRYKFFDEVLKKENANKIAIAHNMNDNAETVLLNLIRGSGLTGLEGIQPKEYGKYIRPLINCKREEIEKYCEKYDLKPRIDYTNKENIYKRNKIRNELIPYLKEINPNIVQNLSRLSKIVKDENTHISNEVQEVYKRISNESQEKIEIELKEFNKLDKTIKQNLVIYCIYKITKSARNIEKTNIDDIIKMCDKGEGNKHMELNKNVRILIYEKKLQFISRVN